MFLHIKCVIKSPIVFAIGPYKIAAQNGNFHHFHPYTGPFTVGSATFASRNSRNSLVSYETRKNKNIKINKNKTANQWSLLFYAKQSLYFNIKWRNSPKFCSNDCVCVNSNHSNTFAFSTLHNHMLARLHFIFRGKKMVCGHFLCKSFHKSFSNA